jgi:CRP-like cAMP-binding protein
MVPASKFNILLRNISRIITLTDRETEYFKTVLSHRRLQRRQYLLQADDVCRHESYIVEGCLHGYYVDRDGYEHTTFLAVEDWWISDLESFIRKTPATMTIRALEDTEVLQIEQSAHDALCRQVPKFERLFRLLLQNAFIAHQRRILAMISQSAEERYQEFLERYPQLAHRVPQKYIASYLGVTPEFLSRVRRDLSSKRARH